MSVLDKHANPRRKNRRPRPRMVKAVKRGASRSQGGEEKTRKKHWGVPHGYVFVPKGNVYITKHCRQKTMAASREVFVVVGKSPCDKLGLQVPTEIYEEVKAAAEATAKDRALANERKDEHVQDKAKAALGNAYPKMQTSSQEAVVKHAFEKYSGRVGRTAKLPLDKILLLAVEAHIRHTQTNYDILLKTLPREVARDAVREKVAAIKRSWS